MAGPSRLTALAKLVAITPTLEDMVRIIWRKESSPEERSWNLRALWGVCSSQERSLIIGYVWKEQTNIDMIDGKLALIYQEYQLPRSQMGFSTIPHLLRCASSFEEQYFVIKEIWGIWGKIESPELFTRYMFELATNDTERMNVMRCLWSCVSNSNHQKAQIIEKFWQYEQRTEERLKISKCMFDCSLLHSEECDMVAFVCGKKMLATDTYYQIAEYLCQYAWRSDERGTCIALLWTNVVGNTTDHTSIAWLVETLWNFASVVSSLFSSSSEMEQHTADTLLSLGPHPTRHDYSLLRKDGRKGIRMYSQAILLYSLWMASNKEQRPILVSVLGRLAVNFGELPHMIQCLYETSDVMDKEFVKWIIQCLETSVEQDQVIECLWKITTLSRGDRMPYSSYARRSISGSETKAQFVRSLWEYAKTSPAQMALLVNWLWEFTENSVDERAGLVKWLWKSTRNRPSEGTRLFNCLWEHAETEINRGTLVHWLWESTRNRPSERTRLFNCLWEHAKTEVNRETLVNWLWDSTRNRPSERTRLFNCLWKHPKTLPNRETLVNWLWKFTRNSSDDRTGLVNCLLDPREAKINQKALINWFWTSTRNSLNEKTGPVNRLWDPAENEVNREEVVNWLWNSTTNSLNERVELVNCLWEHAETEVNREALVNWLWKSTKNSTKEKTRLVNCLWERVETEVNREALVNWLWDSTRNSSDEKTGLVNCLWERAETEINRQALINWLWGSTRNNLEASTNLINSLWERAETEVNRKMVINWLWDSTKNSTDDGTALVNCLWEHAETEVNRKVVVNWLWDSAKNSTDERTALVNCLWGHVETEANREALVNWLWESTKNSLDERTGLASWLWECAETEVNREALVTWLWESTKNSSDERSALVNFLWKWTKSSDDQRTRVVRSLWQCTTKASAGSQVHLFNCLWVCASQSDTEEAVTSTSHVLEMVESQCSRAMTGLAMTRTSHATRTRVITYIKLLREVLSGCDGSDLSPTLNMFPADQRHHYRFILGLTEELFDDANRRELYDTLHKWAKASCQQVRQRWKKLEELFLQFTEFRENISQSLEAEEVSVLEDLGKSLEALVKQTRIYAQRFETNVSHFFKTILPNFFTDGIAVPEAEAFKRMDENIQKATTKVDHLQDVFSLYPLPGDKLSGLEDIVGCHKTTLSKVEELRATRVESESNSFPTTPLRLSTLAKVAKEVKKCCSKTCRSFTRHKDGLLQLLRSTSSKDMEWLKAHYPEKVMRSHRLGRVEDHRETIQFHAMLQILYDNCAAWTSDLDEWTSSLDKMVRKNRCMI